MADGDQPASSRHVQISFFCNDERVAKIPDDVFDVPMNVDPKNLNDLVNQHIRSTNDEWNDDVVFELLIGETFLRSTLEEFIEEYTVDTERVVKIECVVGVNPLEPQHDFTAPDWVSSIHVTDHHVIATTYNGELIAWDKKGKREIELEANPEGIAYKCSEIIERPSSKKSLENLVIAVGGEGQSIRILELVGKVLVTRQMLRGHERTVETVAVNKDKTRLISGAFDSHLKVWNLEEDGAIAEKATQNSDRSKKRKENYVTKTPMVTLGGHKDAIVCARWCTWNRAHCISASWDHTVAVWDLELAGEVARIRHSKAFTCIDVSETSGLIISSSTDAVPRLYDTRSAEGNVVKQSFVGHSGWVSAVKWHPEHENVFVSSSFDKVVKMWDIRSAKTSLYDLRGHEDRVLCVDVGTDGCVASGGADCGIKVYGKR